MEWSAKDGNKSPDLETGLGPLRPIYSDFEA